MITALIVYWVIAGVAVYLTIPDKYSSSFMFALCLLMGGVLVPAEIMAKVLR